LQLDKVFLRGLKVDTVIGIWDWERHITQTVSLDVEMATDARRAADSDAIASALNYKEVAKRLIQVIEGSRFELVESLAEAVAKIIVQEFGVPWVSISVAKPGAVEGSREVGIMIERRTEDYA
jgi:dihydroneopterin aldolase